MIQQITKGIKISVKTKHCGTAFKNNALHYAFFYFITIENTSTETVKLTDRFWEILDPLNKKEIIDGPGVVGQTPTLKPNDHYNYTSGCLLESKIGAMKGFYTMINLETFEQFKVIIPTFQLSTKAISN